ncbi:MAG: hypothetical protein U9N44_03970, partial [Chloroflexota bacterium]|nr:hypothetical protein [Chloroflexota bacterium]
DIINEAAGIDLDELDNAPAIISENLMFPYEAGLDFIMEFEDWDAINEAFSDPPQSTEQIIHPEKYLSVTYFDKPQTIAMPDIDSALGGTWEMKYSDVLGEFNTRIYLEAFLTNTSAGDAAAGWDGDKLEYWKNNAGEQLLVMYWIWDTRNDAEEFFDAYLDFMEEKTGGDWNLALDDTWDRWWQTDDRSVYLSKQGSNTLVVITTDIDIVEDLVAEFD